MASEAAAIVHPSKPVADGRELGWYSIKATFAGRLSCWRENHSGSARRQTDTAACDRGFLSIATRQYSSFRVGRPNQRQPPRSSLDEWENERIVRASHQSIPRYRSALGEAWPCSVAVSAQFNRKQTCPTTHPLALEN